MMRPLSWSMRFAMAIATVFAMAAISAGGIAYFVQTQELKARLWGDAQSLSSGLLATLQYSGEANLIEHINLQSTAITDGSMIIGYFDQNGSRLAGNILAAPSFSGQRVLNTDHDLTVVERNSDMFEDQYFAIGTLTDKGRIIVGRDTQWIAENREVFFQSLAIGLGAAFALSFGLAIWVARRNEHRVQHMERILELVSEGTHSARVQDSGKDDLAHVSQQINTTLDRLEASFAAVKQVSTDIAHDLRAPLSRLRLKLEPLLQDANLTQPQLRLLGDALTEIDHISSTFDTILRLSRLQSGQVVISRDPIDLNLVARDIYELLEFVAEDADHKLTVHTLPYPTVIAGDQALLIQALINLVDNAILHTPKHVKIAITVSNSQLGPAITVSDNGPGLNPADFERVRKRFVRLDAARHTKGTGLGLSLVETVVNLHGGALVFQDNDPGLRVTLQFHNAQKSTV